jgi:hypothetical protein
LIVAGVVGSNMELHWTPNNYAAGAIGLFVAIDATGLGKGVARSVEAKTSANRALPRRFAAPCYRLWVSAPPLRRRCSKS